MAGAGRSEDRLTRMKVLLFGATGMVGQGALRECLLDERVTQVLAIGRTPTGKADPKLAEIVPSDLSDLSPVADQLSGVDACLFCLGVSSAGMSEAAYRSVTYDLTLAAAHRLHERNPQLRFLYISGQGTNTNGRAMWAQVKGQTEDALLALGPQTYMFRRESSNRCTESGQGRGCTPLCTPPPLRCCRCCAGCSRAV